MSKFPMVVQAVYEGLELHEMVFLRDELERRTGALKDGAMPSETKERDRPAPAVLSAAGADAPGFGEIGGGAPRYDWAALCARAPFQMFVAEAYPSFPDARSFVAGRVCSPEDEADVAAAYCAWFEDKKLWGGDDPLGGVNV
ncbi:TPA: hypothetical protein ACKMUH_001546 [Neisseria gonorrhoeae]|uniref:hypothetical protein n=1 Tax=Neisseria gonorrhoeae TaxID=485 RepID=UPI00086D2401|nr:hypothetical protein [Neisseria gonorrhoeae]UWT13634.1 hypothetical protein NC849_02555 [Neisseria gonorrhoeae]UWT15697.1 hypothetical protein NC850_02580 [Neisseria gonorrhoeae]UXY68013.1 hypothetical protein OCL43_02570 [Neisseria gonorrhoeae]UXY70056.1 hypothetical protein OCL40_02565 [Neisseria gonorrhoeae]UXY70757.1 hypothetical protein OCL39_05755 [Neisseria gonorrhoeae]